MAQLFRKTIVVASAAFWLAWLVHPAVAQGTGPADPPSPAPPAVIAPVPATPKSDVSDPPDVKNTPDVNNPVEQAGQVVKDLTTGDVKALRRGPLLIHGNYCGIGNRPGTEPIDALDTACMRHDACTKTGKLPSCSCNDRLREESTGIAEDPATPANLQALAKTMAASMAVLICK